MLASSLMAPVFVQVLLTFVVIIWVGRARAQSLATSKTSLRDRDLSLGRHAWSDAATQASNNFKNQFEMPVLFYAGVAFALILHKTDVIMLALAWGFVVSRIIHAYIHLGNNTVRLRGLAYTVGVICLLAFWIMLFLRVSVDTPLH